MGKDDRRPRDVNALAARIVAEATGQADKTEPPATDEKAAAKGRARSRALTPERRREIAQNAARARWAR